MFILQLLAISCSAVVGQRMLHGPHSAVDYSPRLSVKRTKDCPDGFDLVGKNCVLIETFPPDLICPPLTTALGEDCVSHAAVLRSCPKDCVKVDDVCKCVESIEASPSCDVGEISGNQCRIETAVSPICPPGFRLEGDQCLRRSPPNRVCPMRYKLQGDKCVKRLNFSASPVCPSDFSLSSDDGVCTKSVAVPSRCLTGFSLVNSECVKEVPRVLSPCPDGFRSIHDSCLREQESMPRPVCPVDFVLDSHHCVKEVPVPSSCPGGSSRGSTNTCERPVAKLPVCENTEELTNGHCRRVSRFTSESKCPDGFNLEYAECKKILIEEPRLRCVQGVLEDGRCLTRSSTPPRLQCPPGYEVDKGFRCVRDVPYDCPEPVVECDKHQTYLAEKNSSPVTGKISKRVKASECRLMRRPSDKATCTRIEALPVQFVCPDGVPPQGKTCNVKTAHRPEVFCTKGEFDEMSGKCLTIAIQPSVQICSEGQSLQPDGSCIQINERLPTFVCPDQAQLINDVCVVIVPEVNHPNKIVRQSPEGICDVGVRRGEICVEVEKFPIERVCPSGSYDRVGRCLLVHPVIIPKPDIVTQSPDYVCPDGARAIGKSCSQVEVVQCEHVCATNGILNDSACVYTADLIFRPAEISNIPVRLVCPTEYQQEGHLCLLTKIESSNVECPSGFNISKNGIEECTRFHERVAVCPNRTERAPGGNCIKRTLVPPRVTEIKVCTKGEPGC